MVPGGVYPRHVINLVLRLMTVRDYVILVIPSYKVEIKHLYYRYELM